MTVDELIRSAARLGIDHLTALGVLALVASMISFLFCAVAVSKRLHARQRAERERLVALLRASEPPGPAPFAPAGFRWTASAEVGQSALPEPGTRILAPQGQGNGGGPNAAQPFRQPHTGVADGSVRGAAS